MPRVSVLMAAYNVAPFVRQAVDSVLCQTLEDWELLVVDDASTDETVSVVRQYAAKDARIRLFEQHENQGPAVCRNVALQQATGNYICMLDADDWLSPDALQLAAEAFARPDIDCVVLELLYHYDDGSTQVHTLPDEAKQGELDGKTAFRFSLDWSLHGLAVVRRELHLRYPYDTRLRWFTDDDTTRGHYLHSRHVAFCSGQYHYRKHTQSGTMQVSPQRFQHMTANLYMAQTLEAEGMSQEVRTHYDVVRWHNYKALMRLYYIHCAEFGPSQRKQIWKEFRRVYASFHRTLPFALFVFRQYAGYLWYRVKKACVLFGRTE